LRPIVKIYLISLSLIQLSLANDASVEGKWKTIDDKTGKAKSIVHVWAENGELKGQIDSLFRAPDEIQDPLCLECKGDKHNQKIKGMIFLFGMHQKDQEWSGGQILDPKNGKTYRCIVKLLENGKKLSVRGYIGFALIGRTQTWQRVE
jgi:uncharacterized protein (DUF2147 family)